ncbi:ATP-dependent DNA helicase pfh1 [Araneus ventricosus]|uniref:ATP-dependent DNA helicase n=1 Tax=Araneus ventricosus TaxID=182803 RepID=A0A4Y2MKR9_ARAVE|nr:ATP-dependent DNA helicase pfh1 [Araneus ventricosus]
MQISGATDDGYQTAENLRVFAELDSQIAAACDKYIDMLVPTEDDPNRADDIVLPILRMISNDEYSAIISTMNLKQREFLLHVLHCFKVEKLPLYYCMLGGAGVGGSRLINALTQTILCHLNMSTAQLDSIKVLLCAPTGKAAYGIKGTTLHSGFVLPVHQCSIDLKSLSNATRNTLLSKMRDTRLIIIDETSMVGSRMIQQVDLRLKQIFQTSQPFAGMSLIFFGDFNQLPPVGDRYIFQRNSNNVYADFCGNPLWEVFHSYYLTEIMRQKDDQKFAMALNNLAKGVLNETEIKLFKDREVDASAIPRKAIRLFRSNAKVDAFNDKIIQLDNKKITAEAIDKVTGQPNDNVKNRFLKASGDATARECQGQPYNLNLSLNVKYMITVNVNVGDDLVNGAVGILKYVDKTESSVRRIWMLLPEEFVGKEKRREVRHKDNTSWTAIEQVVRTVKPLKSPYSVVRKQFPVQVLVQVPLLQVLTCSCSKMSQQVV